MCDLEMHRLKFTVAQAVIAKRSPAHASSVKNAVASSNFRLVLTLGKERENGQRQVTDIRHHRERFRPTQSGQTGRRVREHKQDVDTQHQLHSPTGDGQVRTSIKQIGCERADGDLSQHERSISQPQQLRHQAIAFDCDI